MTVWLAHEKRDVCDKKQEGRQNPITAMALKGHTHDARNKSIKWALICSQLPHIFDMTGADVHHHHLTFLYTAHLGVSMMKCGEGDRKL